MTAPVTTDDIVAGALKYLQAQPAVLAVLGTDGDGSPWLWGYRTWATVEGSQSTACIIASDGGWAAANQHNTLRFPRLLLNVWADPVRDGTLNGTQPGEVMLRANAAFEVLDRFLHRPQGGSQMWGSIRTVDCVRMTEPAINPVPDGDGVVRLQAYYAVTQG